MKSLTLVGLLFVLALTACFAAERPAAQAIVGKWVNSQGGEIYFYADGTGFIPGLPGEIAVADTVFTYSLPDETHLSLTLVGQKPLVIKVDISDNTMTWHTSATEQAFVYSRSQ